MDEIEKPLMNNWNFEASEEVGELSEYC